MFTGLKNIHMKLKNITLLGYFEFSIYVLTTDSLTHFNFQSQSLNLLQVGLCRLPLNRLRT